MRKITITVDEGTLSLSARRAWIEIDKDEQVFVSKLASLSARRAWIEIAYVS